MTAILTSPTASLLASARNLLNAGGDFLDVSSGLALRVLERGGQSIPDGYLQKTPTPDEMLFRRTPVLAAYGFVLSRCESEIRQSWYDSIERLRGREPFPGDGISLVHNPEEVLGILSGLEQSEDDNRAHREWFNNLMLRGLKERKFRTPISRYAAKIVVTRLSATAAYTASAAVEVESADTLLAAAMTIGFAPGWTEALIRFEEDLADRILSVPIVISTASEAAAALVLATRLIDSVTVGRRGSVSPVELIVGLCRRFPLFTRQLQSRHNSRPPLEVNDEYDVQDLFHGMLRLHFDDVRAEEVSPSFGGNSSRVDFFLPRDRIAVEVKMMRPSLTQKAVAKQLIEDIARYAKMGTVDTLICLVYDPDCACSTPQSLEDDLAESTGRLGVHVVVCSQGR